MSEYQIAGEHETERGCFVVVTKDGIDGNYADFYGEDMAQAMKAAIEFCEDKEVITALTERVDRLEWVMRQAKDCLGGPSPSPRTAIFMLEEALTKPDEQKSPANKLESLFKEDFIGDYLSKHSPTT